MLIERPIDFNYDYRMRCPHCTAVSLLSADDYATSAESIMLCTACGRVFNFGPKAIEIRTLEDEALKDSVLPDLAWYHSTTDPDWPRPTVTVAEKDLQALRDRGCSEERIEKYRQRHHNKAIHVGTFEAAIESMLRRMRNQDDQKSTFYLHRVKIVAGVVIEPGFRDENSAEAAQLTSAQLLMLGVDGIRYLNAYESIGSLSLALVRGAIEATQKLSIPIAGPGVRFEDSTMEQLRFHRDRVTEARSTAQDGPLTPLQKVRQKRARHGFAVNDVPIAAYSAQSDMERMAQDRYLLGLSPVVREDFLRSVESPKIKGDYDLDLAWLTTFKSIAELFTLPGSVLDALSGQPWRAVLLA